MNAHNKTQFTHARINCALKDSNGDSTLSKVLKFTILASNASSSSTKHTQDHKGLFKACSGAGCRVTLSVGASLPGVTLWSWASVSGVTSTPSPLEPAIEVSLNEV
uniref:Uncharacterized protein n=1 Tax=Solanum tuberosum TaxID=4113 RepID=M1DMM3_SOLTU